MAPPLTATNARKSSPAPTNTMPTLEQYGGSSVTGGVSPMASRQRALGLCARRVLAPRVAAHGTYCEYDGEGGQVIPTMIVFGLVFGRWWKTTQ